MNKNMKQIHDSYINRCNNIDLQKSCWHDLIKSYPPHTDTWQSPGAPALIARHGGDLGLAILWIVQTALPRPVIDKIIHERGNPIIHDELASLGDEMIGALAHSEDRNSPLILEERGDDIIISGKKKYITGGKSADFIFLTARLRGEKKISRLIYLADKFLKNEAMMELDLGCLYTTSHTSLQLNKLILPSGYMIDIDGPAIRRHMKIWGIMERSLILESLTAYLLYLGERLSKIPDCPEISMVKIESILESGTRQIGEQIKSIKENRRIEQLDIDFKVILEAVHDLQQTASGLNESLPNELKSRFNDLSFIEKIRAM